MAAGPPRDCTKTVTDRLPPALSSLLLVYQHIAPLKVMANFLAIPRMDVPPILKGAAAELATEAR